MTSPAANATAATPATESSASGQAHTETSSQTPSDVCVVEQQTVDSTVVLDRPVGVTKEITIESGKTYLFGFDKSEATSFVQDGDDLIVTFNCGGVLILHHYASSVSDSNPATFAFSDIIPQGELARLIKMADAQKQDDLQKEPQTGVRATNHDDNQMQTPQHRADAGDDAAHKLAKIASAAGDDAAQRLANIEPAAGAQSAGTQNSGYGFNSSFAATPVGPLAAVGPLGPTALNYGAEFPQPRPFIPVNTVADDNPEIGPAQAVLDETTLSGGAHSVSGQVIADFGNDGPGVIAGNGAFSTSGSLAGGSLTSGGVAVVVTQTATGYEGTAGGVTVFTLTIDPATGNFVFTQVGPLDHADGNNSNDVIDLVFGVVATDTDGDTANTSITIAVADDAPLAVAPMSETISESGLSGGPVSVSDTLVIDFGQDTPGTVHPDGVSHAGGDLAGGVLSSGGVAVVITQTATGYVGMAGGTTVFTINVDNTGAYTFTLFAPLDHSAPGNTITLDFGVNVVDFDGDHTPSTITINITDDVPHFGDHPAIGSGIESVDETNLGPITVNGALVVDKGADVPATISPDGTFTHGGSELGGHLTSHGVAVIVTQTATGYVGTAGGVNVFTITVNPNTGAYSFTLNQPLDHANGSDPNDVINLHFGVKITDSDGDTDTGSITINVFDDGPVAANDSNSVNQAQHFVTGNVVANDDVGSDFTAKPVIAVQFGGTVVNVPQTGTVTINGAYGVLTIDASGNYKYETVGGNAGKDVFTYTIRDTDLDKASATLTIDVADDKPCVIKPPVESVDETNLGPITVGGTVSATYGTDGPGAITPNGAFSSGGSKLGGNLTSHGVPVVVTQTADGYVGKAGADTVFTLTVNTNGTYSFTLHGVLDHADGSNPNDVINLNFGVKATDIDGDTVSTVIRINVLDDAPIAHNDVNQFSVHAVNKDLNIVLILDVSGSMQGNKLALLKSSVAHLLSDFHDYTGGSIKVHIVPFSASAQEGHTFTITTDSDFNAAVAFLNGLTADGGTNYEAPMQSAINWLQGGTANDPIPGADTHTYFISDGEPNRYVTTTGTSVDGTADRAMQEITGTAPGDNVSEVALLQSLSTEVIGVGIGVSAMTIARLDIIDSNGHALDVHNPADLDAALQGTNPLVGIATGNVITGVNGGPGADDHLSHDLNNTVTDVSFNGTHVAVDPLTGATINGDNGTLHIAADGSYTYTLFSPLAHAPVDGVIGDTFTYTLTDGDGDGSNATLTLQGLVPTFLLGQNVDDVTNSTAPYVVGDDHGVVTGGKAADILVGDAGGSILVPQNKDFNVVLILDVSGSMGSGAGSKLQLLKDAVNHLMADFHNYHTGTIKVDIIPFDTQAHAAGTFTVTDDTGFANAVSFINALTGGGFTNYEDPMQAAASWLNGSAPIAGADTFTYFVSDGEPNRYVDGANHAITGSAQQVMDQITGVADGTNEVGQLQSLSDQVIGVGIGVNSTTLARLDIIDSHHDALNVQNPNDLDSTFQNLSPLNQLANTGGDTIAGHAGDDLIFGDVLFTDTLAAAHGIALPKGSGWAVFEQLEAGHSAVDPGWTRLDTINYIQIHAQELGQETVSATGDVRSGGNDTINGDDGNDIIFGQEGRDFIDGGAGSDTLYGGSGDDVFIFRNLGSGVDTVHDFSGGDALDVSGLLNGYDPVQDSINDFVFKTESGGNTTILVDANGSGNIANATAIAVLQGATGLDLDQITHHGQAVV